MKLPLAGLLIVIFSLPALAAVPAPVTGLNPDGSLDKQVVSKAYFEGDFPPVQKALETFLKTYKSISRDDSIYSYKYLSVIYASEPAMRARAESFMYQLIRMMPTIDLIDLYISDNIEAIFAKVKNDYDRFNKSQVKPEPQVARPTVAPRPIDSQPKETAPVAHSPATAWKTYAIWGTAAGVGVGVALYFVLAGDNAPASNAETPRPVRVKVITPSEGE